MKRKFNIKIFISNCLLIIFFPITWPVLNLILGWKHYSFCEQAIAKRKQKFKDMNINMNTKQFAKNRIKEWSEKYPLLKKVDFKIFDLSPEVKIVVGANDNALNTNIFKNKQNKKWVIICHGWTENQKEVLHIVDLYYKLGFNVITYDARVHGMSEERDLVCTVGYLEKLDLIKIISWAVAKFEIKNLILHGQSMGAATCIEAVKIIPIEQQHIIKGCVIDGCFDNLDHQVVNVGKNFFKISKLFYKFGVEWFFLKDTEHRLNGVIPSKGLKKIKNIPFLLIHGTTDNFVNFKMSKHIYKNKTKYEHLVISKLILVSGAEHVKTFHVNPSKYQKNVKDFLNTVFK